MTTAQNVLQALETYSLKKVGANSYRCKSPLRSGSDSPSFSVLIHDDEHGAWKDFVSEESGSLYDLARLIGVEIVQNGYVAPAKSQYSGLNDYARAHGVEPHVFEDAMWSETTHSGKQVLEFKTKTGTRLRFLEGNIKFKSPRGYRSCFYGLNALVRQSIEDMPYLVYCNGEPSVVVGQNAGLPAFTVTGGGEREIPENLFTEFKAWVGDKIPTIIIALDCDQKGFGAAQKLQKQFVDAGFKAYAVDLNLWEKGDIADFCKMHEYDSWEALRLLPALSGVDIAEKEKQYSPWQFMTLEELLNLPAVKWYIDGLVQQDAVGMIYGDPGIGKSFFALDMALSLASEGYKVVYNIGEDERGFAERIRAWEHHHKKRASIIPVVGAVPLLQDEQRQQFINELGTHQPDIIFIDTVARSMVGGDENSARDVGQYIQVCDEIRKRFGCTVLLVHHTNKGGLQERGSSAFRGAVNFMIRLTDSDGLIQVESNKSRSAAAFEPLYKRLLPVKFDDLHGRHVESAVIVDAEKIIQTEDDPLYGNQEKVLRLLASEIYEGYAVSRSELIASLPEVAQSTLTHVLSRLKVLGYLEQPRYGKYRITSDGRSKIGLEPLSEPKDAKDAKDARVSILHSDSWQLRDPPGNPGNPGNFQNRLFEGDENKSNLTNSQYDYGA
jgi:DNA-binding transcriptional ArsR family regulator